MSGMVDVLISSSARTITLAEFNLDRTLLYMMLPRTTTFLKKDSPVSSFGLLTFLEFLKMDVVSLITCNDDLVGVLSGESEGAVTGTLFVALVVEAAVINAGLPVLPDAFRTLFVESSQETDILLTGP